MGAFLAHFDGDQLINIIGIISAIYRNIMGVRSVNCSLDLEIA